MELSLSAIRHLADSENPQSFANRLRTQRFQKFEKLVSKLPLPLRILDVGGTNTFWQNRGWAERPGIEIFSLNLFAQKKQHTNIEPLTGDATNLSQFDDGSFDVAFSNSVIEHLFTSHKQSQMASEIQRVGKSFWVQTPNYWFPFEPHFHVPAWQWLPLEARVALIRRWRCGWRGPCPDSAHARELVEELRLLSRRELRGMFPGAVLVPERFAGLVKSWTVVGGILGDKLRQRA